MLTIEIIANKAKIDMVFIKYMYLMCITEPTLVFLVVQHVKGQNPYKYFTKTYILAMDVCDSDSSVTDGAWFPRTI